MIDTLLLALCLRRKEEALKYQGVVKDMFVEPLSTKLHTLIMEWWMRDTTSAETCDTSAIRAEMLTTAPKSEHAELELLLTSADEQTISDDAMMTVVARVHEQEFVSGVLQDMILLEESAHPLGTLVDVWPAVHQRYIETAEAVEAELEMTPALTLDIHGLLERKAREGLSWCLPTLQTACGPIADDFIVVASRPDSGKTGLVLQQAVQMAAEIPDDHSVVIFRNEEGADKLMQRVFMLALGQSWAHILAQPATDTQSSLEKVLGGTTKILFYPRTSFTTHDVAQFLETHKPGAIIFDQLTKVDLVGKHDSNDAERIRKLANFARQLTQQYMCPVFTTVWADGTAQNVEWIGMDQIYGSKTGIQGEADAVITIGRANPSDNIRSIFVPKNKLPDADNTARNARFSAEIDPVTVAFRE